MGLIMRFMLKTLSIALGISVVALISTPTVLAVENQRAIGKFGVWTAVVGTDNNAQVCFITSQPQDTLPKNVNRDPVYFVVQHALGRGARNEVSTLIGYPFKKGSTGLAKIDGKSFTLFTEGSAAWLLEDKDESVFVDEMKKGAEMIVTGTSHRGTLTTDTYSLAGVTKAMEAIDKACNL